MTLKERLKAELDLSEDFFSSHESDLYVRYTSEISKWLKKNYEYHKNIKLFRSKIDLEIWMDIPFGYFTEFHNKRIAIAIKMRGV